MGGDRAGATRHRDFVWRIVAIGNDSSALRLAWVKRSTRHGRQLAIGVRRCRSAARDCTCMLRSIVKSAPTASCCLTDFPSHSYTLFALRIARPPSCDSFGS